MLIIAYDKLCEPPDDDDDLGYRLLYVIGRLEVLREMELDQLPKPEPPPPPIDPLVLKRARAEIERRYIAEVLIRNGGNRTAAAKTLGVTHSTFRRQCRRLGINVKQNVSIGDS